MSILFRRKITDISDINDLKFPYDFREFDTVGLVVEIKIEKSYQEVWLTNPSGRYYFILIFFLFYVYHWYNLLDFLL